MWKDIYNHFKTLNPYPIGIKEGECTQRYLVISEGTQNVFADGSNKVGYKTIDIILFVPITDYPAMDVYAKEIRSKAKELKYLRKTGNETPIIPDSDRRALTMSIEYILLKKLEG